MAAPPPHSLSTLPPPPLELSRFFRFLLSSSTRSPIRLPTRADSSSARLPSTPSPLILPLSPPRLAIARAVLRTLHRVYERTVFK